MKNYATGNSNPEAFITKGKQRVKQFGGSVYINDGDNFEVEIFNPTTNHILAKISMNGKIISNAGLVLRPGERVFLERHIDTNNKFVFSTYEVNGNNDQVKKAIALNGLVKVEFYNETSPVYWGTTTIWSQPSYFYYNQPTVTPTIFYTTSANSITTGGVSSLSGSITNSSSNNTVTTTASGTFNLNVPQKTKKIETGTIEKGESSNQHFSTSERNFYYSSFHKVEWHILPKSQQPVTSKDINKQYCTECGSKITKSTFKFCPNCGNKLD